MLEAFAKIYRERSGRQLVEVAHMEIAEPSIPMALERCVERGAQDKRLFLEDQEPFARRPERRQARL